MSWFHTNANDRNQFSVVLGSTYPNIYKNWSVSRFISLNIYPTAFRFTCIRCWNRCPWRWRAAC